MNSCYKNQVKFALGILGIIMITFWGGFAKERIQVVKFQNLKMIIPPSLSSKDTIAIVAPAFQAGKAQIILPKAQAMFQDWGLNIVIGQSVGAKCGLLAGEDSLRRADLQKMLDDPTIKAIIAYRGGYGSTRIMDDLDFSQFLQHPKWVIGFSDLTTIHLQLHQLGVVSIHGEMLWHFDDERYQSSWASLKALLFGKPVKIIAKPDIRNNLGEVQAPVVGGNMMMICTNIGTKSDLDTRGKILVLEEVDENLYALDRMMVQLKRTGKLDHLAGLIVGGMVTMKDKTQDPFGKDAYGIIKEHTAAYGYPVAFNFPIGHAAPNIAFPHGGMGRLTVSKETVRLAFDE
jgi:muramoyltetrapeptide carboxypeptidase